jgi:signal transduction histidine kinase/DNA-binding NarL/FixJ family response regulator
MAHRILVVDDSPFILELVKDILIREGYEVDRAMNGHEAMLAIGEDPPDLVLLDIIMPEMSGYQVCRLIRSDERLKALPVVMMTAKDTQKDRFWGLEVGADAYITKPIEEQRLLETISPLLKEKREPIKPVSPEELTSETLKGRADDLLERKLLEMTIINETGKLFTYLDRPDALLQNVLMLICQVVDYDMGAIFVGLPGADEKFVAIRYRNQPLKVSKKSVINNGSEMLAKERGVEVSSIRALEIRLIEESELGEDSPRKTVSSEFTVTLRSSSGVLGSIVLFSSRKEFFIADDRVLVEMIASQLSVLLDNVQLLQERDRQLAVLELEKNRVEAILRNMGEGVLVTDWSYRIIHSNPMALQLLGKEKDLEGQHLFDHIPKDTFAILEEQRIGVKNPTWTVRFSSIKEKFPLVASVAVVDEKEEQTLGLIILLRDMSAEDELDHLKSKFLENVSNHLRNPLTSLKGFLDLLLEDVYASARPRQREYLDVMTEETDKLTEIVEDLLSLSRIELTDFRVLPEDFSISEALLSAMVNNQSAAQAKGLTLKSEIAEGLGQVHADKESASDIINRLVSNAIKYSPPDSAIILGARVCSRPGQEGAREIYVRDFGTGVPDDKRGAIFEKYREHRLFSDADARGIGLGLPICKQLAEMNGGTIGLESAEGGGSVFYFTLPARVQIKNEETRGQ